MSDTEQLKAQAGRCNWCQHILVIGNITRDHLFPRVAGQRSRHGGAYVLACESCNRGRGALSIGSHRFLRWIKSVINGRDPIGKAETIRQRRWRAKI
jgi:hypothetical protein